MTVVIVPPSPIMTPADIPGDHSPTDTTIAAYIAAAVEEIDGPSGWVGRAFGPQTLEAQITHYPCDGIVLLPCPPVVSLTSITYIDTLGNEQPLDTTSIILDRLNGTLRMAPNRQWSSAFASPGGLKVRYVAGYDGNTPGTGGTGPVPSRVKQAIRFMVQDIIANASETLNLKAKEVEGLGRKEFFVSRADSKTLNGSAENLLSGLRTFRG